MEQARTEETELAALQLLEEEACAGYLDARKALKTKAVRLTSQEQLAAEQPTRVDYRRAYYQALEDYNTAAARTRRAYNAYRSRQIRTDALWTATKGRYPRVLAAVDGANKVA